MAPRRRERSLKLLAPTHPVYPNREGGTCSLKWDPPGTSVGSRSYDRGFVDSLRPLSSSTPLFKDRS